MTARCASERGSLGARRGREFGAGRPEEERQTTQALFDQVTKEDCTDAFETNRGRTGPP